jgi:aspartate carbamoyltransferase catalytic subunit
LLLCPLVFKTARPKTKQKERKIQKKEKQKTGKKILYSRSTQEQQSKHSCGQRFGSSVVKMCETRERR